MHINEAFEKLPFAQDISLNTVELATPNFIEKCFTEANLYNNAQIMQLVAFLIPHNSTQSQIIIASLFQIINQRFATLNFNEIVTLGRMLNYYENLPVLSQDNNIYLESSRLSLNVRQYMLNLVNKATTKDFPLVAFLDLVNSMLTAFQDKAEVDLLMDNIEMQMTVNKQLRSIPVLVMISHLSSTSQILKPRLIRFVASKIYRSLVYAESQGSFSSAADSLYSALALLVNLATGKLIHRHYFYSNLPGHTWFIMYNEAHKYQQSIKSLDIYPVLKEAFVVEILEKVENRVNTEVQNGSFPQETALQIALALTLLGHLPSNLLKSLDQIVDTKPLRALLSLLLDNAPLPVLDVEQKRQLAKLPRPDWELYHRLANVLQGEGSLDAVLTESMLQRYALYKESVVTVAMNELRMMTIPRLGHNWLHIHPFSKITFSDSGASYYADFVLTIRSKVQPGQMRVALLYFSGCRDTIVNAPLDRFVSSLSASLQTLQKPVPFCVDEFEMSKLRKQNAVAISFKNILAAFNESPLFTDDEFTIEPVVKL
ncbi:hypothetical protein Ciccas_007547 [Cichlidogyrus casuarinus]|uniref:Uncharacterized protein n=1 Tax=Cichlidogyrus casuarinus TaxID=1844966 RepID=A0ABD2Q3R2_9PLAT